LKVLITGGSGFIGYNLYNHLKNKHNITLVDNFYTSTQRDNVINLDISKYSAKLEELVKNIDVIYHFAGSVGVKKIDSEFHNSLMNTLDINDVLFRLCEKHNKKLIYASTSEVYGNCKDAKETDFCKISSPEFGRGSYSCAKLMSEFILKSYTFPSVICRFFGIVGRGQLPNYGMVLPNFIKNAKDNKDLIVYGDGQQSRCFCSIDDTVIMLELLLDDVHNGEIYNIGNSETNIKIIDLAKKVIQITNSKSKIVFKNTDKIFSKDFFEIYYRSPCTKKFDKYYKARYDIDSIIESVI